MRQFEYETPTKQQAKSEVKNNHSRPKRTSDKTTNYKTPSDKEFNEYNGEHCRNLWESIDNTWKCPGCHREKRDILRWTQRKPHNQVFYGWIAPLCLHHDHSNTNRFPETLICGDCNSADGTAKRKLKLPKNFSFSPDEIRHFISPVPNAPHTDKKRSLDYDTAESIFKLNTTVKNEQNTTSRRDPNRRPCEYEPGYDWRTDPYYDEHAIRERLKAAKSVSAYKEQP